MGRGIGREAAGAASRPPVVRVSPPTQEAKKLWKKVAELAEELSGNEDWCLVGGLMVQLLGYEYGVESRPTGDIDVLGDAARTPRATKRIAELLVRLGASMPTPTTTNPTTGYRFEIGEQVVEVLGPDGLSQDPPTVGSLKTIQVGGGRQALRRTETVMLSVSGSRQVPLRRPTLLGAILLKAKAVKNVRRKLDEHRQDLIRLLSLVEDPRKLAQEGDLKASEKKWLQQIGPDLAWEDAPLSDLFDAGTRQRARAAYELLLQA